MAIAESYSIDKIHKGRRWHLKHSNDDEYKEFFMLSDNAYYVC